MTTVERLAVFSQVMLILFASSVFCIYILKMTIRYGNKISPVVTDGSLGIAVAVAGFYIQVMSGTDAYHYAGPYFIFYSNLTVGMILQACNALRAFRSKSYTQHVEEKAREKVAVELQEQAQADQQQQQQE